MKLNKGKIFLLSAVVLVAALGLLAFRPFTGQSQDSTGGEEDQPVPEPVQMLADALGISVTDLQAAYEAAGQAAREKSVSTALERGLITQEQADEMLNSEGHPGRRGLFGRGLHGEEMDALVAAELNVPVEKLQAAQADVLTAMIEQAVADGRMTRTAADLELARQAAASYVENAWASAYQGAVQSALDDGAIDQAQADLLLQNMDAGPRGGFGRMPFGGPHGERHHLLDFSPADQTAE